MSENIKFSKPIIISVEGIISAGKTSLINNCLVPLWTGKGLRVRVIKEPVDKWEKDILPKFYEDPKRWAYHFQSKAFLDRVIESKTIWEEYKNDTDIFILDRSIFSDPQFMKVNRDLGNITEMEMNHYNEWWNMWKEVMPFVPDLFIYLDISIEESMKRKQLRARNGECRVSVEYQTLLKKYHDEKFGKKWFVPPLPNQIFAIRIIKVDSHYNFNDDNTTKENVATRILSYIEPLTTHIETTNTLSEI